jgi:hypothetical protein
MTTRSIQSLEQNQFFLRILMFSVATVLIWVAASLFLSQQRTDISPQLQLLARPLNPNIHLEVIDQIQQKRTFSAEELQGFPILRLIHNQNGTDTIISGQQVIEPLPSPTLETPAPTPPAPEVTTPTPPPNPDAT